jgi:hypothetical protein
LQQPGGDGWHRWDSEIARELRSAYSAIVADLGGEAELSHVKRSLVERFVFLEAVLQGIEHQFALAVQSKNTDKGAAKLEPELIGRSVQAVNSMQGLAKTLGVERRGAANAIDALYSSPASDDA